MILQTEVTSLDDVINYFLSNTYLIVLHYQVVFAFEVQTGSKIYLCFTIKKVVLSHDSLILNIENLIYLPGACKDSYWRQTVSVPILQQEIFPFWILFFPHDFQEVPKQSQ